MNLKRPRKQQTTQGPSRTQQHHAQEADINTLILKHRGMVPGNLQGRQPTFGEWSAPDFHAALNRVNDVRQKFLALPARLRSRFSNDPHQLLRFTDDPKNRTEALLLGLVVPTEEEAAAMARARAKATRVEQIDLEAEIASETARKARLAKAEKGDE